VQEQTFPGPLVQDKYKAPMFFIYDTDNFAGGQDRYRHRALARASSNHLAAFPLSALTSLRRGFFCSGLLSAGCSRPFPS